MIRIDEMTEQLSNHARKCRQKCQNCLLREDGDFIAVAPLVAVDVAVDVAVEAGFDAGVDARACGMAVEGV